MQIIFRWQWFQQRMIPITCSFNMNLIFVPNICCIISFSIQILNWHNFGKIKSDKESQRKYFRSYYLWAHTTYKIFPGSYYYYYIIICQEIVQNIICQPIINTSMMQIRNAKHIFRFLCFYFYFNRFLYIYFIFIFFLLLYLISSNPLSSKIVYITLLYFIEYNTKCLKGTNLVWRKYK